MSAKLTKYEVYKLWLDGLRDIGVIASVFLLVYLVMTK